MTRMSGNRRFPRRAIPWFAGLLLLAAVGAARPAGHRFMDLWMTPDQQGRHAFDRSDFKTAAERFRDPLWKGVALYRAGDFQGALNAFALVDTAESYYNQGDALARLGKYPEAVKSYEEALKRRPGWREAVDNRALVQSLIPPPEEKKPPQEGGQVSYTPDQVQFDGTKGQKGKVQVPRWDEKQMADLWLRNIQTTPADFLRQKFAIQAQESAAPAGEARE